MSIRIFTDGAAIPNPGDGGAGFIILLDDKFVVASGHFTGIRTTSCQAELLAINKALSLYLEEFGDTDTSVILYSDSRYALGAISGDYRAKKNSKLIADTRSLVKQFKGNLRLFWVRAHRDITKEHDLKTKEIILWNSYVDVIADTSAKKGEGYSYTTRLPLDEFKEKFNALK